MSSAGGADPVWKTTGGELYFRNGDTMMAVQASTASTFTAGRPPNRLGGPLFPRHEHVLLTAGCDFIEL